jgi:hypothetical protein
VPCLFFGGVACDGRGSDHIALIMELLGKVPRKVVAAGKYSREFFSKKGNVMMSHYPYEAMTGTVYL